MTPNGELARISGEWEYIDTEDECFLYSLLSLELRDKQEEDSWFNTNKSLITSWTSFSASSALDDDWRPLEILLGVVFRSVCCQSKYWFLTSDLAVIGAGDFVFTVCT